MPRYHTLGEIPRKRHVQFHRPGGGLHQEELMGNRGFSGLSSLLYHLRPPTMIREIDPLPSTPWAPATDGHLRPRHFRTAGLEASGNAVQARIPLFYNGDVAILFARPTSTAPFFYRNGQGDELIYVSDGEGVLESVFGELPYGKGDYLVIPRGIVHRLCLGKTGHRLLIIESRGIIRTPGRYRNEWGQLLEWSPFCERDIRVPERLEPRDEEGEFEVLVKQQDRLGRFVYGHHPYDVVGWDGYYYPWAFNIGDFEPIVGRVHQPPPVHQVFEGDGFVICNFVPRLYDFHPEAIPVPYHHTNAQSDEVIYYASQGFMSRRGIEYGSITLHPDGIPHGPHPGTVESSLGKTRTDELAVMIDTFRPLTVCRQAETVEDPTYFRSWLGKEER